MSTIFAFFKLPIELRDMIYDDACSDYRPVIDSPDGTLSHVYKGFTACKQLWYEYTKMIRKRAVIHFNIFADCSLGSAIAPQLPAPEDVAGALVLIIDLKLSAYSYDGEKQFWFSFEQTLQSYAHCTSVAIEIYTGYSDGSDLRPGEWKDLWSDNLARISRCLHDMQRQNLERYTIRLDERRMRWSMAPDHKFLAAHTYKNVGTIYYNAHGPRDPPKSRSEALHEMMKEMCLSTANMTFQSRLG